MIQLDRLIDPYPSGNFVVQAFRYDLMLRQKTLRDFKLNLNVDLKQLMLKQEILTLLYQEQIPELARRIEKIQIETLGGNLLQVLSRYHAVSFHPFLQDNFTPYVRYYLEEVRPLLYSAVLTQIDPEQVKLTVPTSSLLSTDSEEIPF